MPENTFNAEEKHSVNLSPEEKLLLNILGNINPALADIFRGALKTLSDIENADRFSQAANSIRGITDILVRNVKKEVKNNSNSKIDHSQNGVLQKLKDYFDEALKLMPTDVESDDKFAQQRRAQQQFDDLSNTLLKGRLTQKQILKRYFGDKDDLARMPHFAKTSIAEIVSIWAKSHDYFVNVSHYGCPAIDENEFKENWQSIQRCLRITLTLFVDHIPSLDDLLKLEFPPDE
jgi:hypothetical protein